MLGAIFGAIALIPTVIILRKLVERSIYPVLYSLVVFYLVDQLRVIADAVPTVSRPLFLTEMLGGFLFFGWLYRFRLSTKENPEVYKETTEETTEEKKYGGVFRTVRIAALVVLPFFAVSFLANVFGYVNLARLVGDAVLRSAYSAVILYAAVRIIRFITNHFLWSLIGESLANSRSDKSDFVRRSRFCVAGDRKTKAICHEFHSFAPLGLSDREAPFLAETKVPSIKHSDKSLEFKLQVQFFVL